MATMAIAESVALGMSLPHRSPDPIPETDGPPRRPAMPRSWASRTCGSPTTRSTWSSASTRFTVLTWAAAVTTRIRVGVSVLVLPVYHPVHVAHAVATLDRLSGGRATLGVGIGPPQKYAAFDVPDERRVRRFVEAVALIRALWAGDDVTFEGEVYAEHGIKLGVRPASPPPIWLGSFHPDALRRAARLGDGWMGAGGSGTAAFARRRAGAARGTPGRGP